MTYNTFASGVNTSFSTELNENFTALSDEAGKNLQVERLLNNRFRMNDESTFGASARSIMVNAVSTALVDTSTNFNYVFSEAHGLTGDTISMTTQPLLSSGTDINRASGMFHYDVYTVYDEFDDGSISESLWTKSGSINYSESAASHYIEIRDSNTNDGTLTSNDLSAYPYIQLSGSVDASTYNNEIATIRLTDGTNGSSIVSVKGTDTPDNIAFNVEIYVDWANKRGIMIGLNSTPTVIDFTSWTSLKVQLDVQSNHSGTYNRARLTKIRLGNTSPSTVPTISLSADGGSNYDTLDFDGQVVNMGTAGTSLQLKLDATVASNEVLVVKGYSLYMADLD